MPNFVLAVQQPTIVQIQQSSGQSPVDATPLTGATPAAGAVVNVANLAALAALPMAGQPDGSLATVSTLGCLWTYRPASVLAPDVGTGAPLGATIVAANGGGNWLRGPQLDTETPLEQVTWFVDKQNVSGTASIENTGVDAAHAIPTEAEMSRRLGGWSPSWGLYGTIAVVLTYLSASTDNTDPSLFTPNLQRGSTFTQVAGLGASTFTGTLLAVTAKVNNVAPGNALRSTFTTTTGAVAVRTYLVNTTRGNSFAFAQRDTGGGNWQISQPLDPVTFAEVDTWANGDAIVGSTLMNIDIPVVGGKYAAGSTPFFGRFIKNIRVFDPSTIATVGMLQVDIACTPQFIGCSFQRRVDVSGAGNVMQFQGCCTETQFTSSFTIGSIFFSGGITFAVSNLGGCQFANDTILGATVSMTTFQTGNHGPVCLDTGASLRLFGLNIWQNGKPLYGPSAGVINTISGTTGPSAGTFAANFLVAGAYQLNGVATAYKPSTAAGVTTWAQVALTMAAVDAAGGTLTNTAGAAFSNGAQP